MSLIPFAGAVQKFNRPRDTGYRIERSLRFNSADSTSLSRTPGSASNRKTWTWSGWVKRCEISTTERTFFGAGTDANNFTALAWINDALYLQNYTGGAQVVTNTTAVYRDASAWYHIVLALDTTQATAADRAKIYVNGIQQAGFSGSSFSLNQDFWVNYTYAHRIGSRQLSSADSFSNQYMTEVHFVDGQALTPTDFGEFNSDTGVWQPIAYTGTYGTNGFYLNFSDNSGTTSTTLGADSSGNGNNWTPNNFSVTAGAGNDSLVDSPTRYGTDTGAGGEVRGNYCTLNPLASANALSNGNLQQGTSAPINFATLGQSTGKWYWEVTLTTQSGAAQKVGIANANATGELGDTSTGWAYIIQSNANNGQGVHSGSTTSTYLTFTTGDVLNVAVDVDAGKVWFGRNGTWVNSGAPASGTGALYTDVSGTIFPAASNIDKGVGSGVLTWNFGQRPFAYTAPSGFKALVTTNLPEPTIADGGEYFNTVLYTGDGTSNRTITGVGFQPDFLWLKMRSSSDDNVVIDVVRGGSKRLKTNTTDAESDLGKPTLASAGFIVSGGLYNNSGETFVGWNWKANGAGVSNTAGSITSTVSANTDSGFSIVTYAGNSTAGATIGHGLGVAPSMVIVKARDKAEDWLVYHKGVASDAETDYLQLNSTAAASDNSVVWNDTAPTSTVFTVGADSGVNGSTYNYLAYCFAAVPGYSAFGSYTGNGSADGSFVYLGFRPRYVLIKNASTTGSWVVHDTAREPYNVMDDFLNPNTNGAEFAGGYGIDCLSNGFKLRNGDGAVNGSGNTLIYACFAENPFQYALAR